MMNNAEVKELIVFLGLSKPSTMKASGRWRTRASFRAREREAHNLPGSPPDYRPGDTHRYVRESERGRERSFLHA